MINPEPREWPAHRDLRMLAVDMVLDYLGDEKGVDIAFAEKLADSITAAACERIAAGLETEQCICSLDSPHGRYARPTWPAGVSGGSWSSTASPVRTGSPPAFVLASGPGSERSHG